MGKLFKFGLALAALVVVLDQISKGLVLNVLNFSPPGCREYGVGCGKIEMSNLFDLSMVWNKGVSFGLLRADSELGRWGLSAFTLLIAGVFTWWLRTATSRLSAVALGLVIGGALGNIIDRVAFGAVVDFFDFQGLGFPWVFNVADAAINVGAALLAVDFVFFQEETPGSGTIWQGMKRALSGRRADAPGQAPPQNRQDQG